MRIAEEVGSASALIVGAKSAEAWHGVGMVKHRRSIMLAIPHHAGAQRHGTNVTLLGRVAVERKIISSIAVGADRTRIGGSTVGVIPTIVEQSERGRRDPTKHGHTGTK